MKLDPTIVSTSLLEKIVTNQKRTLAGLSFEQPVLLIFLRHFGCVFCRESIRELSDKEKIFAKRNVKVVFVHMSDDSIAQEYFNKYDIHNAEYISDPTCEIYSKFGLTKGSFSQLFGLKVMLRGFEATVFKGNTLSLKQIGDGFQMPGIFLLHNGQIKDSYVHKRVSDKPDYEQLMKCCHF